MAAHRALDPYRAENHPELQPGEVWFTNSTQDAYGEIHFKTKRRGRVAYDARGVAMKESDGVFPVFISTKELFEHEYKMQVEQGKYK